MPTPQEALRAGRSGLLTSLVAAARAVEDVNATPAMLAGALGGVVAAQQAYNSAVVRIPLTVMTDGVLFNDMEAQAEPGPGEVITDTQATKLLASTNARLWADHFLAENRNRAIDRETLVGWFANAIGAGFDAGSKREGS